MNLLEIRRKLITGIVCLHKIGPHGTSYYDENMYRRVFVHDNKVCSFEKIYAAKSTLRVQYFAIAHNSAYFVFKVINTHLKIYV